MGETPRFQCVQLPTGVSERSPPACWPPRWAPADSSGSCRRQSSALNTRGFVLGAGPRSWPQLTRLSPLPWQLGLALPRRVIWRRVIKRCCRTTQEDKQPVGNVHLSPFDFSFSSLLSSHFQWQQQTNKTLHLVMLTKCCVSATSLNSRSKNLRSRERTWPSTVTELAMGTNGVQRCWLVPPHSPRSKADRSKSV